MTLLQAGQWAQHTTNELFRPQVDIRPLGHWGDSQRVASHTCVSWQHFLPPNLQLLLGQLTGCLLDVSFQTSPWSQGGSPYLLRESVHTEAQYVCVCLLLHRLWRSWHSCPRRMNAGYKNTPSISLTPNQTEYLYRHLMVIDALLTNLVMSRVLTEERRGSSRSSGSFHALSTLADIFLIISCIQNNSITNMTTITTNCQQQAW